MVARLRTSRFSVIAAVILSLPLGATSEELAQIMPHSLRYGTRIGISAFDDPVVKGVTCYVSASYRDSHAHNAVLSVSCHRVGRPLISPGTPRQAQVFGVSADPIFRFVHVIRVLDTKRNALLYYSYTESSLAGNLPGHVDIVTLPASFGSKKAPIH